MKSIFTPLTVALAITASFVLSASAQDAGKQKKAKAEPQKKVHPTGYTDTPFLPGGKWRVHDDSRPRPEVVTPGETAANAPSDAVVLFDGSNLDKWIMDKESAPADWTVKDGYMEVPPKDKTVGGYIRTKDEFGDVQLHIEWASPAKVEGDSQGRGNSGVFLLGNYEIQVLDSFENKSYADGQASALYGFKPPLVNAARKPGEWQTYDIIFEAPKFDDAGKLVKKAYVTVIHNGVVTHHRQEFLGPTGHKRVAEYKAPVSKGPIKLQNHGNPTRFRNIWVRELRLGSND